MAIYRKPIPGRKRRYHHVMIGYLPQTCGPITTWWHKNAAIPALLGQMHSAAEPTPRYNAIKPNGAKYRGFTFLARFKNALNRYTSYGCYTVVYVTADNDVLCHKCATEQATHRAYDHWPRIVGAEAYDEGPPIPCANCDTPIESSYGDPNADNESED